MERWKLQRQMAEVNRAGIRARDDRPKFVPFGSKPPTVSLKAAESGTIAGNGLAGSQKTFAWRDPSETTGGKDAPLDGGGKKKAEGKGKAEGRGKADDKKKEEADEKEEQRQRMASEVDANVFHTRANRGAREERAIALREDPSRRRGQGKGGKGRRGRRGDDEPAEYTEDGKKVVSLVIVKDADLQSLTGMGFAPHKARTALMNAGGDLDAALDALSLGEQGNPGGEGSQPRSADVLQLQDMGFSREDAAAALEHGGGSLDAALAILLAEDLPTTPVFHAQASADASARQAAADEGAAARQNIGAARRHEGASYEGATGHGRRDVAAADTESNGQGLRQGRRNAPPRHQERRQQQHRTRDDAARARPAASDVSSQPMRPQRYQPGMTAQRHPPPRTAERRQGGSQRHSERSSASRGDAGSKTARPRKSPQGEWRGGDACRAVYTGDGNWYDAEVCVVDPANGSGIVKFVEYGDVQECRLSSLQRRTAQGEEGVATPSSEPDPPQAPPRRSHGPPSSVTEVTQGLFAAGGRQGKQWQLGDICKAVFPMDGKLYDAVVQAIVPGERLARHPFPVLAQGMVPILHLVGGEWSLWESRELNRGEQGEGLNVSARSSARAGCSSPVAGGYGVVFVGFEADGPCQVTGADLHPLGSESGDGGPAVATNTCRRPSYALGDLLSIGLAHSSPGYLPQPPRAGCKAKASHSPFYLDGRPPAAEMIGRGVGAQEAPPNLSLMLRSSQPTRNDSHNSSHSSRGSRGRSNGNSSICNSTRKGSIRSSGSGSGSRSRRGSRRRIRRSRSSGSSGSRVQQAGTCQPRRRTNPLAPPEAADSASSGPRGRRRISPPHDVAASRASSAQLAVNFISAALPQRNSISVAASTLSPVACSASITRDRGKPMLTKVLTLAAEGSRAAAPAPNPLRRVPAQHRQAITATRVSARNGAVDRE